jgi:hypothetical protein
MRSCLDPSQLLSATPKGAVRVAFPSTLLVRGSRAFAPATASPYGESIFPAIIFGLNLAVRSITYLHQSLFVVQLRAAASILRMLGERKPRIISLGATPRSINSRSI